MNKLLAGLALAAVASAASAGDKIAWQNRYDSALALAKSQHKLMMIDFYTDWCGWCKKLDSDTYTNADVIRQSGSFVSIKLDAEKAGKPQATKFKPDGFPTIVFVSPDEQVVWKIVGYMPPKGFVGEMKHALDAFEKAPKWEASLKTNPNNLDALFGLLPIRVQAGRTADAEAMLMRAKKTAPKDPRLIDAYNTIGDAFQNSDDVAKAIGYFQEAAKGKDESKAAYALISIAVCKQSQGKLKDAIPELERLLKMGKAADEYRADVKAMLAQARKG